MNKLNPVILSILLAQCTSWGAVLLDQPFSGGNVRASSTTDGTTGFKTWDRISLSTASQVTKVTWVGSFLDLTNLANNPVAPDADFWHIDIASDAAGSPGAVFASATLPFADVLRTLLGTSTVAGQPVSVHSYEATLASALFIPGQQMVWMSIYSTNNTTEPTFGWWPGSGGDGVAKQYYLPNNSEFGAYSDRALKLEGSAVPEPGTHAMLGAGMLAIGLARRKR